MISVCMATYNGSLYIKRQIDSILAQLDYDDELIICDDCSQDGTYEIINKYADKRIKLYKNEINIGVNKTFERSINMATGELIYLSDQDDIWLPNKCKIINDYLKKNKNVDMIQHDAIVIDEKGGVIAKSFYEWRGLVGPGVIRNMLRDTHLGCCMVFRRNIINDCFPITTIPYHDKWIGITAELTGHRVVFIKDKLIKYVRHYGTSTSENLKRRRLRIIVKERIEYLYELVKFYLRYKIK